MVIGCIIEHEQQPLAWVGGTNLSEQLYDALAITRFPALQADEVTGIGGIGPKDIEAVPARGGLQLHRLATFDPALAGDGGMQQVRSIEEIDLATARQRPLV